MKAAVGIPEERLLTQHPNGWPLILDARCLTVTPQVLTGAYEPEVYAFVSSCIRPGDHVLEIGCNVGLYTIRMAELTGPSGRIVGFEPNPVSHRILRDNMIACGLRNRVEIHQKAVGERDATVSFRALRDEPAGSHIDVVPDSWTAALPGEVLNVDMVSITKVLEGLDRRPDVIKIDVEGNELRLLESLVTACVPMIREGIVITEILGSSAASQPDCLTRVLEAIRNEGLELLRIVDGGACEPVVADGPHLPPWADYVIAAPQRIFALKALSL